MPKEYIDFKPCHTPDCKGHPEVRAERWPDEKWHVRIECEFCTFCTAWFDNEEEAAAAWNYRPVEDALKAELAESQAYALSLERALGEAWTPITKDTVLQEYGWGNGWNLYNQSDGVYLCVSTDAGSTEFKLPDNIRLCRAITVTPAAPVPSAEVRKTVEGLLTSAIAGTESTIRTRDYHGLRKFATTEEEWIERYKAALAWLNRISAAEADQLRYALDFAVEQNEEMASEIDNIRQENSTLFDRAALRLAELKATQAELAESQRHVAELERALGEAWEPVPSEYEIVEENGDCLNIEDGTISTSRPDTDAERYARFWFTLPDNIRLCRRTSSSPTAEGA